MSHAGPSHITRLLGELRQGRAAARDELVALRYFTGLSEKEAAEALGVSISTLKRDWNFAKAWLLDQLSSG